ncbi:MAG TPA: tetratricopeptide repeat protein [Myxococcales bacterium]|nr:tetratricopeptide repeat protein [Myxococcales bacterium]
MALPLLAELKRRRVFRALLGYAIIAFAVLQIIEPIIHGLQLPDWTLSLVVVGIGIGFPLTLALAWVFDLSASGIERTRPVPVEGSRRASVAWLALLAAGVALLGVAVVAWHFALRPGARGPAAPSAPSVAVLPFVNMSAQKDDEYFSDGITEEVINALANVEGLRVVSRTSAFAFKGKNLSVRKIGEELAVATVLEGSVRRQGDDVRIVAQLINAVDGYHLWSKTYDRKLENVFAVEDELARSITDALRPQLLKQAPPLVGQATASTEAHDLYLRGRHFWNKRTTDDLKRAAALFRQALDLDPRYALAHAGLADSYALLAEYSPVRPGDVLPQAAEHARKALELDPALAEPHATVGLLAMSEYDWTAAEREFKRAIELRSAYATAHQWYALLLVTLGRLAEARVQAEQAVQLDPASPVVNNMLGLVLYASGDYPRAIEAFRRTLELEPGAAMARGFLACAYVGAGRKQEALAEIAHVSDGDLDHAALRAWVLWSAGERDAARQLARELLDRPGRGPMRPGLQAALYAYLGERDRAFALLDRAYAEKDWSLREVKVSPMLDPLRDDPRFAKLLKKLNLG